MPIIKSAKKRVRVIKKKTTQNARTKRTLRSAVKAFSSALTSKKSVSESHRKAQSAIDTAVKKGVMSKNKAARKKRQLSKQAKATGSASTPKAAAKKAPAKKKPAAKKSTAKK